MPELKALCTYPLNVHNVSTTKELNSVANQIALCYSWYVVLGVERLSDALARVHTDGRWEYCVQLSGNLNEVLMHQRVNWP